LSGSEFLIGPVVQEGTTVIEIRLRLRCGKLLDLSHLLLLLKLLVVELLLLLMMVKLLLLELMLLHIFVLLMRQESSGRVRSRKVSGLGLTK
jgi:hypothetical protein